MKTKSLPLTSSGANPFPRTLPFAQRLTQAVAARARLPLPPLGRIGDPYLLDRLQAPLRRYRD